MRLGPAFVWFAALLGLGCLAGVGRAQGPPSSEPERPGPPALEGFEDDADGDGSPDGWYNLRDAALSDGGREGGRCLRFENNRPGRPARASRAFGVDGRRTAALIVGIWVRMEDILKGERWGEEPGLIVDFFDDQLHTVRRGTLGPWSPGKLGNGWVHVAARLPVPVTSRDAILTVGLLGATGRLDVDTLTIEEEPRGAPPVNNLLLNGGFELGESSPAHWVLEGAARRVSPGDGSAACLKLSTSGSRATCGLGVPVGRFDAIEVNLRARPAGLRGSGGAVAEMYFLDDRGRPLPRPAGVALLFRWSGSGGWAEYRRVVSVPQAAAQAVFQIEKTESTGTIEVDDISVTSSPAADFGAWRPYREAVDTTDWWPYAPAEAIEPGSALDASHLLGPQATWGQKILVHQGRLHRRDASRDEPVRARFFGVSLMPGTAFQEPERIDHVVDLLARSGVNLVRLGDLDAPVGPGRSLVDDTSEDTSTIDPVALSRLDHLIAACKAKGLRVALELQGGRWFREGDGLPEVRRLPPGGGPAAAFDAGIRRKALALAEALLGHVNPETGLALRDDPVLAWVTLAGELSLFDLLDDPGALPPHYAEELRKRAQSAAAVGRRLWQAEESAQWKAEAAALRAGGWKGPTAGGAHWRRESDYVAAQAAQGLELIEDRLFWYPPAWSPPGQRSLLWDPTGGILEQSQRKRRSERAYSVGQWALQTGGALAQPFEAADALFMAYLAASQDWDALVRRGVARAPWPWGSLPERPTTFDDILLPPGVLNAFPPSAAVLPHAASLVLRGRDGPRYLRQAEVRPGRLSVETPYTVALAGWPQNRPLQAEGLALEVFDEFGVLAVSSAGPDPILKSKRLLVTAVARSVPTGFTWADNWRRTVAEPGLGPLLMEPVRARVAWRRRGTIRAYALDASGRRVRAVDLTVRGDEAILNIDRGSRTTHWELIEEAPAR